jgi:hypothetical protein
VSERIPLEELELNASRAKLVYASPFLERVVLLNGEEAYECPWDLVPLFRGGLGTYRLTLASWDYRAWCEQGCNHFWVYVFRRGDPRAERVRIGGKRVFAVLEGPTVRFVICTRIRGTSAPWVK